MPTSRANPPTTRGTDDPILATRITAPLVPAHLVSRARLLSALGDRTLRPVTLVCAPAGFGKTTCVADWLRAHDTAAARYSLDAAHDDPRGFLVHLTAALAHRARGRFEDLLARVRARESGAGAHRWLGTIPTMTVTGGTHGATGRHDVPAPER